MNWKPTIVRAAYKLHQHLKNNNQEAINAAILSFFQEGYEVEDVCDLLNWQPEAVQPLFDRFEASQKEEDDGDLS